MQQTLDDLVEQAQETLRVAVYHVEEATLDQLATALGSVTSTFETLGKAAWVMKIRAAQIRDRELTERRDDTTLEVMDTALASLDHGRDVAKTVCHLLEIARSNLIHVVDGQT